MKDIYKNPMLYYVAAAVIVGLWPLLVWAIYLPAAREDIQEQMAQYEQAAPVMMGILTLDPERLEFADSDAAGTEFAYANAVRWIGDRCGIPPSNTNLNSSMIITTKEQKSQTAIVDLKQVEIVKFAKFLSMIQLRWPNLQCERVKIDKKEVLPDTWDVNIRFKYYY